MLDGNIFANFMDSERELASETLADGTRKVVVGVVQGPVYRVDHVDGDTRATVHSTPHADEARSVYDAFDGRRRGWHPAYPPRGASAAAGDGIVAGVHAAGSGIADCVRGFLDGRGETLREGSLSTREHPDDPEHQWSARFASERDATGFSAAGRAVPGGYVMTWWK